MHFLCQKKLCLETIGYAHIVKFQIMLRFASTFCHQVRQPIKHFYEKETPWVLIIDIMFCPREEPNSAAHGLITKEAKNACDPIL